MGFKERMISYLQERDKPENRRTVYVDELKETIYYKPVTAMEMDRILAQSGGGSANKDYHVAMIIEKSEDESGAKIFTMADKPVLEQLDSRIVSRVSNAIWGGIDIKEQKKS